MRNFFVGCLAVIVVSGSTACASEYAQWRGPNGDGKSEETGLLKEWPEGGPKMLWSAEGIGVGYSTVAVTSDCLYTAGMIGKDGYLFCFDLKGKEKWRTKYGAEWDRGGYKGPRSTPTVNDGLIYLMGTLGTVYCFNAKTGKIEWQVNLVKEYGLRNISWGISESLLVDGYNVICTPGGNKAAVVALNKKTGKEIWKCIDINEKSGYCSPIVITRGKKRIIVTMLEKNLIGIDASNGKMLWKHEHNTKYGVHANTPICKDGIIFYSGGYGSGCGAVKLSSDGKSVSQLWKSQKPDTHHGGNIEVDGYVYGTGQNSTRGWVGLDLKSGAEKGEENGVGKGSFTYAGGMFYCYGERGMVGLAKPEKGKMKFISQFRITKGKKEHWAHPVVVHGMLFIRHGDALMAFKVKK